MDDKLKGGLSDKITEKYIANKFDIPVGKINKEVQMGIKIELEHVDDESLAKEIAMDHLIEMPDYYTRLKKMETEGDEKWNVNESNSKNIKKLLKEYVNLDVTDETPETTEFTIRYNDRPAGKIVIGPAPEELSDNDLQIIAIAYDEDYVDMARKITVDTIGALWDMFKETNRILLMAKPESRAFWHKIGATRLNDTFLMLNRGH